MATGIAVLDTQIDDREAFPHAAGGDHCGTCTPGRRLATSPATLSSRAVPGPPSTSLGSSIQRLARGPPLPRRKHPAFFAHLLGAHLAGYPNRPSGAELARLFRAPRFTPVERD